MKVKVKKVKSLSRVRLFATPWSVAYQDPPSMGFSRQEYWSGLPSKVSWITSILFNQLSVQFSCLVVSNSATPRTVARQASLSITKSQSLLKLMSIDAIQSSHPLSAPPPPTFNLSQHQGLIKWDINELFASGGQNIGISASTSVLPMDIQDWFPLGETGWISLL